MRQAHPPKPPPPSHKGQPRPQDNPPPPSGADDPLVVTKVHVPYPTGVEVGTVTCVHPRKAGVVWVVWVEYPGNPTLYKVARGHLFPTPQAAQEHLERVGKGKQQASVTRRLTS